MSRNLMCQKMEILCLDSSERITFFKLFAKLRSRGLLKELFGEGGARLLKMPTQSLSLSYKHFSFPIFLVSAPLAAQLLWALCPVCRGVNPALVLGVFRSIRLCKRIAFTSRKFVHPHRCAKGAKNHFFGHFRVSKNKSGSQRVTNYWCCGQQIKGRRVRYFPGYWKFFGLDRSRKTFPITALRSPPPIRRIVLISSLICRDGSAVDKCIKIYIFWPINFLEIVCVPLIYIFYGFHVFGRQ